jgi:SNF2 family DNA or RNA helicase
MNHEMKQQGRKWRRVLVVLNKQIISTWMDEFARWVPERPYPLRIITAGSQLPPPSLARQI